MNTTRRKAVTSHDLLESRLVSWVRETVKSNHQLARALQRIHSSYRSLLAGEPAADAEELLLQVESAMQNAKALENMFASDLDCPKQQE